MVNSLRKRQAFEIGRVDQIIQSFEGTAPPDKLKELKALRQDMQDALDSAPAPSRLAT
jgi:hypothetical protein